MLMDKRIASFLASARSCALSPVEHAQVRAALAAHTLKTTPSVVLRESSDSLRLTDYEKAIGRANLLRFMRANPVEGRGFSLAHMLFKPVAAALSSAAALMLIGGGMAYAAEGSLPGDLLYPVKVHITEPLRSALSATPVTRAQWDVRQIERRLEEAAALPQRPDQSGREAILHSQIEQDVGNLKTHLGSLPPEDQRAVRHDLLSELADHQKSLRQIQTATGIPSALKILAEDAAGEMQGPAQNDRRSGQSSSSEQEKQNRQKPERNSTEREGERIKEDRQEGQENTVQSLLRLLREASSSSSTETSSAREQGPESRKEQQKVEKEDGR